MRLTEPLGRDRERSSGFTLAEISIALFILTVGTLGLLPLLHYATSGNQLAQRVTTATFLAQQKFEEFRATPYDQIVSGSDGWIQEDGNPGGTGDYLRWWNVTVDTPGIGMKTVTVTTEFNDEDSRRRVMQFSTIVAQR